MSARTRDMKIGSAPVTNFINSTGWNSSETVAVLIGEYQGLTACLSRGHAAYGVCYITSACRTRSGA